MKQTDVDRFIRRIQVGSRVDAKSKVIRLKPVCETITLNMEPSMLSLHRASA